MSADIICFRVPLSKKKIQVHLVQLGAVETIVSIICGELSNPMVRHGLTQNSLHNQTCQDDILVEEWWGAVAALMLLVVNNDSAKEVLDASFGIVPFTRLIFLPCIDVLCTKDEIMAAVLINFVIELCVRGERWLLPVAPFFSWAKLPPSGKTPFISKESKGAEPSSFAELLTRRVLTSRGQQTYSRPDNTHFSSVTDISPVYLMKTDTVHEIMTCLYPYAMHRTEGSETCVSPGRFVRASSGSVLGGGMSAFDRQRQDSVEPFPEYADDTSTGRGSFSVHSLRGFPHSFSLSAFPTPPPSVTGGDRGGDDGSIAMNKVGKARVDDSHQDYCGEYFPFLAGLNWGLCHLDSVLLGVCYEFLLQHRQHGSVQNTTKPSTGLDEFVDITHRDSDPLLMSLREQSVQQHLQTLLFSTLHDSNGRLLCWEPHYSRLQFCSIEAVELLVGLAVITVDELQAVVLKALSHVIDGNPSNINLLSRNNFVVRMTKLLFDIEDIPRGRFCQIISQILRHRISTDELKMFVDKARRMQEVDVKDAILASPCLPAGGFRKCLIQSDCTDIDDAGCQILYMLGVAAENPEPREYFHFDQGDPFSSGIQFPPLDRSPPPGTGFSVITWIRIGGMGNVPISILMQTTVQSLDASRPGDLFSMVFFFRVLHRVAPAKDNDSVSIASGGMTDTLGPEEILKKRVLQLCVSYRRYQGNHEEGVEEAGDSVVGLNGGVVSSFVGFSTPDVLVDYDFSEMGSWHLLSLSLSSSGISCVIDGNAAPVLYWTALGYVNLGSNSDACDKEFQLPPNIQYPIAQRDQCISGCLGAMFYDKGYFQRSVDALNAASAASSCNDFMKDKIMREFEFLQCYTETVKGFSGSIAALHIVEGVVDCDLLSTVYQAGAIGGIHSFPSNRKLLLLTTQDTVYGSIVSRDSVVGSRDLHSGSNRDGDDPADDTSRGRISNRRASELALASRDTGAASRRISRSLSPISVSRAIDGTAASRDEMSLARSRIDVLPPTNHSDAKPAANQQPYSTSLVSDILTMFSGPSKDDKYSPIQIPIIHGSTTICRSAPVWVEMERLGSMAMWYPLLVIDRPHQVSCFNTTLLSIFMLLSLAAPCASPPGSHSAHHC